jgi:hypothetical protein
MCTAPLAVVVGVDPDGMVQLAAHHARQVFDLPRQRSAVGVTQHDDLGAAAYRRLQSLQRVVGVLFVAVEEVLGVVNHPTAFAPEIIDAVLDHAQVFVAGRAQHLGHVHRR